MKHTTQYLYDIEPSQLADLNYVDALNFKVSSANQLITHLMYDYHHSERDEERVSAVHSAIKHTSKLLEELQ